MEARLQQSSPDAERGSAPLEYLFVRADTMAIVTARLNQDDRIQFVPDPAPLEALEQHCAEVRDKVPHVSLGLTGLPILEFAEMKTSERDMTWASVFSLLGVSLLFWAGFGGWRYPMLGIAALLIGIAWTCGYLTLAVGHLNILSMSFGVILIGLGIDFAIHYVARYQHEAAHRSAATLGDTAHLRHVLDATAAHVGPPLLAGGITTSLAFFATAATEFRGVAELGLIAGGGVLICTAATLLMMPSLIWITNSWHGHLRQPTALLPIHRLLRPLWDHPRTITLVSLTVTLLLAVGATRVKFDHNLLKLQAENLESVQWERRLLTQTDRSTWFAVSLAIDPSEARSRRAAFERLPSVSRVEEIASLMPTDISEKQPWIQQIADDLAAVSDAPPSVQPLSDESFATDSLSQFAHQRVPTLPLRAGGESDRSPTEQVNVSRATLATKIWHHLRQLRATANPTPPTMEDIPAELRTRFLGRSGTHLLRVFAAGNPWESDTLAEFVRDIESVDAQITGHPVQAFYASRQMERSYYRAAVISAVLVGFVLYLDLRHIGLSLLAAIPTCAGMVQMFGLMGWLGIPLNPANVIVLPLVIGIGIDDGIHVMHAFRAGWAIGDRGQGSLGASTTNGIVLTSLTSMIGFGSLMLANHQGLQGLGRVVTLGIACCLAVSTITLPCLLSLLASRRNHDAPNQPIACNQNRLK
jgi:hopanoid biosynthesis associated RND transporter like protein HpnN